MNKQMRRYIASSLKDLRRIALSTEQDDVDDRAAALQELENILEENRDNLDNYTEALQNTERVQTQMESQDLMEEYLSDLKSWYDDLDDGNKDEDDEDELLDLLDNIEQESFN